MRTYIVKLTSGDSVELSALEYDRLMKRFTMSGKHFAMFVRSDGEVIMMETIERIIPQGEPDEKVVEIESDEPEKELSEIEAARKEYEAEVLRKSSCTHPADKQELYKTDTKTGPRFFKLCADCGGNRSRFIALKDCTDEELQAAKDWVEKG